MPSGRRLPAGPAAALLLLALLLPRAAARRAGQPYKPTIPIKSEFADIRPCDVWG